MYPVLACESCSGNHMKRIQRKKKCECVACSKMASSVQETYCNISPSSTVAAVEMLSSFVDWSEQFPQ